MNAESKTWDNVKANYLCQVKDALSAVKHPRAKEVLADVSTHLDRRFAELGPNQQSWENFQAIITDMGPASDYAELLAPNITQQSGSARRKYALWVGLAAAVIIAISILLPMVISSKLGKTRIVDNIDYPFVDDPDVIGTWKSVDFVKTPEQFGPGRKWWKGGELFLKELVFLPGGKTNYSQDTWTKGLWLDPVSKTASRYIIKEMDGSSYMFFEWKSGDYTIRHMKPQYYVLKKIPHKDVAIEEINKNTRMQVINDGIDSAQKWLKLVDEQSYDQSWSQAAAYVRTIVSKNQWVNSIKTVREPLGKMISRKLLSKTYTKMLPGTPEGEYIVIQFETSFENKNSAIETVTPMLDKDSIWRVSGYYIK